MGIVRVNYAIKAINLASQLTRLYSSCRLIFFLSLKKNCRSSSIRSQGTEHLSSSSLMFNGVHHLKPVFHQVLLQKILITAHKLQKLDWDTSFHVLYGRPSLQGPVDHRKALFYSHHKCFHE